MVDSQDTDKFSINNPYMMGRTTDLSMKEVLGLLRREHLDENKINSSPPMFPKGGEVYIYCSSSSVLQQQHDYRFDHYRWLARGSNFHKQRSNPPDILKKYYCLKDPKGSWKDSLHGFRRHVYCLRECTDPRKLYIVHYLGDETLHQPSSHGNTKGSRRPFVGTMKQVFTKIESALESHKGPMQVYKYLQSTVSMDSSHRHMATDRPRNLKQVQNVSYRKRREEKIGGDEIFNLIELSHHLNDFFRTFSLLPDLVVSFGHPNIIAEAHVLLSLSKKDLSQPQLLSYDTTFKLGDFYLSPIVMRNITLEGDPIFPVAFLMHEKKFMAYHENFLCDILTKLGITNMEKIPFVTDRERGIIQPLHEKFPQIPNIYCRNHILRDVRMWVKKHGGRKDDVKVLVDNITQLLDSLSMKQYQEKCREYSILWSQAFFDYFHQELEECIPKYAAKFQTQKFAAFKKDITATNNISESMNKVIKDEMLWKEMPADSMALTMFYMQTYYLYEFQRAYCGLGNYTLKEQYAHLQKEPGEVEFQAFYPLEKITENIRSSQSGSTFRTGVTKVKGYRMSQTSLAKVCKDSGGVTLCSQSGTFTVRDVGGSKMQAVTLYPEPAYCSCRSTGQCYHIIAAKMAIRCTETVDKHTYSLSVLLKRKRGRSNKSGRKKPRIDDYDYSINPAPDSVLATSLIASPIPKDHELTDGLMESSELEGISFCEATKDESRHHSTPKSVTRQEQDITHGQPWNTAQNAEQQKYMKMLPVVLRKSLDPKKWLYDEIIDEAISNFICQKRLKDTILLCPTFIYLSVALGRTSVFHRFLERNEALNKDLLIVPFNTDVAGRGCHWLLSVIIFKTKEIIIIDSMKDLQRSQQHGLVLLCLTAACHQVANIQCQMDLWKVVLCADAPQQTNAHDCGVYTVLNAYTAISGEEYHHVQSEHARLWIGAQAGMHKICACKQEKRRRAAHLYSTKHHKPPQVPTPVNIAEIPLMSYVLTLTDKDDSRWSTCPQPSCTGGFSKDDMMALCCICRLWFHVACLAPEKIPLPEYYICEQCSDMGP